MYQYRSGEEDTSRDPLLEAAFTQFVQQAQAPPAFAAAVRRRVALRQAQGQLGAWPRQVAAWRGAGAPGRWRIMPGRLRTVGLVACLVLSFCGNIWLGVQLIGQARVADSGQVPLGPLPHIVPGLYGQVRLAFVDDVREHDLRTLLLSLRATILAGPLPQGVYLVQVPLEGLVPRLRGSPGTPSTPEPMRLLLEELRAHPAIRLAEPATAP
jgi:hypothetical protein